MTRRPDNPAGPIKDPIASDPHLEWHVTEKGTFLRYPAAVVLSKWARSLRKAVCPLCGVALGDLQPHNLVVIEEEEWVERRFDCPNGCGARPANQAHLCKCGCGRLVEGASHLSARCRRQREADRSRKKAAAGSQERSSGRVCADAVSSAPRISRPRSADRSAWSGRMRSPSF